MLRQSSKILIRSSTISSLTSTSTRLTSRTIHTSRCLCKAEFFKMPAMSPTMEKGGIVDWKIKVGETFNSGDVLLEVETDKAQIDVEALNDGVLAKVLVTEGTKDVPVGTPIAIVAEPEDDLKTLELPSIEETKVDSKPTKQDQPTPVAPSPSPKQQLKSSPASSESSGAEANKNQIFLPSVSLLIGENNLSRDKVLSDVKATGPNGRILKGDILAYLGKISQESVDKVATFIKSNSKLDLANIERLKITSTKNTTDKTDISTEKPQTLQKKKEPKIITKVFDLNHLLEIQENPSQKGFKPFTIKAYIEKASSRAEKYAYQLHAKQSDYFDPVFEDLVSLGSSVERFSIKFHYNISNNNDKKGKLIDPLDSFDFFDDVIATSASKSKSNNEFTVKLTVNEKVADSEEKAQIYLKKLEDYIYNI